MSRHCSRISFVHTAKKRQNTASRNTGPTSITTPRIVKTYMFGDDRAKKRPNIRVVTARPLVPNVSWEWEAMGRGPFLAICLGAVEREIRRP